MNIGVDIRCLMDKERTGVGEYTFGLLEALFESIDYTDLKKDYTDKHQFFLFYNSNKDVSDNLPKWNQGNVHFVGTKYPNKLLNLFLWLRIVKLDKIVRQKLDVWFSPNLNFTNLSKKVKHIQTIHDLSFEFLPECFTWKQCLWHWFLNPQHQCQKADFIITPSVSTKQDVATQFKISNFKFQILQPGLVKKNNDEVISDRVLNKYNLPDKYILYLGTLEPRKNVETIVEAYKLSGLNCKLVIAGASGWKNESLLKLISETSNIEYIGYVNSAQKEELYQNASLFLFPSLYEGFGLPVLEAMSYGVPVITSNRTSLPEVVGEAGYLVNPHNVVELTEGMRKLVNDEKLRQNLSTRGLRQAEKFNWNKTAKEFLNLLN